ncbi:MAG: hypothetical protein ACF8PN_06770 [Phycisphaerales bacterium]
MAARRDIELLLRARDEASKQISGVSDAIQELGRKVEAQTRSTVGLGEVFSRSFTEAQSKLELFASAVRTVRSIADTAFRVMRGDLEAAADAAERIPLGIGESFGLGRSIGNAIGETELGRFAQDSLSGFAAPLVGSGFITQADIDRARELEAELDAIRTTGAARNRDATQEALRLEAVRSSHEEAIYQARLSRLDEFERQRVEAQRAGDEAALRAEVEFSKLRNPGAADRARLEQAVAAIEEVTAARIAAIDDAEAEVARVESEKRRAEVERRNRELADLESEIRQERLREQGQFLDAELEAIRHRYDREVEAARRANDAIMADRLRTLQEIEEREARRDDAERVRRARESQLGEQRSAASERVSGLNEQIRALTERIGDRQGGDRFLAFDDSRGLRFASGGGPSVADETLASLKAQLDELREERKLAEQTVRGLDDILRELQNGGVTVVGRR